MQTTDIVIDFTTGLSGSVAWPWPIAVYLFLAGIPGGAVALAITINLCKGTHADNPQMKAATMVGLVTILLGMVCLVLDLTDPFNFWRILIFYNPTSVMSIGVAALLFYIPLLFVLTLLVFRDLPILKFLKPLHRLPRALPSCAGLGGHDPGCCDLRLHRLPDLRADSLPADQHGSSSGLVRRFGLFRRLRRDSALCDLLRCKARRLLHAYPACG